MKEEEQEVKKDNVEIIKKYAPCKRKVGIGRIFPNSMLLPARSLFSYFTQAHSCKVKTYT